jgi:YVTN family beta-propeller protein
MYNALFIFANMINISILFSSCLNINKACFNKKTPRGFKQPEKQELCNFRMKGAYRKMIKRRLFQILPLFFIMVTVIQLSATSKCYAEAFAYIPNSGDNKVSIVKVLDNSITGEIPVGGSPFGVAVGEEYFYVTNEIDGTVSAISITFNSVIETFTDVGASPKGIAVTSDGVYVCVANYSEKTLSIISISTKNRDPIEVGEGPLGVAISPNRDYIYVTNSVDDSLSIISTESKELFVTLKNDYYLDHIGNADDIAFATPYGVAVSPDGYYIYVVNNNSGGLGTLSIISASTIYSQGDAFNWDDYDATADEGPYSLYTPVTVGNDPRCVAVTPDQKYLYVTNYADDTVSVISLASFSVTETVSVGDGPYGVSVTPSGSFVYVVNQLSGTVSVIDTSDNEVIATVADIGNSPVGFGNFIGGKPPRTPTNLAATLEDTTTIKITWTDTSDDELGFKIMSKKYIGGVFSQIATVGANVTEYTDSGLGYNANYYYMVRAYNHAGDSDYSEMTYATTGNENSGCFIATAAYGSLMEPHVKILRDFRDRFLAANATGKGFLNLYYKYSPSLAHFIKHHAALRFIVRWSLLPFVGISWLFLFIGPISTIMLLICFMFLMIFSIGLIKRRPALE